MRWALVYVDEWKIWLESDICLAVVSTAVMKHQEQSNLFLPIILRSHSSRAGTWEAGADAEALEEYFAVSLLMAHLACFLSQPKTTSLCNTGTTPRLLSNIAQGTTYNGLYPPYQPLIKKMLHKLAYRPLSTTN